MTNEKQKVKDRLFSMTLLTAALLSFFVLSCVFVYLGVAVKLTLILLFAGALVVWQIVSRVRAMRVRSDPIRSSITLVLCAAILAGAYSYYIFNIRYQKYKSFSERPDYVTAVVLDCDYSLPYISRYRVRIEDSSLFSDKPEILITTEKIALSDGALLRGEIKYQAFVNTSSFDAERYYMSKGIMLQAEDTSLEVIGEDTGFDIARIFRRINEKMTAALMVGTKRDTGGVAAAVLLGNREYISDTTTRNFRRLGISHLLVVSGTHFSVLLAFAERELRKIGMNPRRRALIEMAMIVLFMAITGFSSSVLRAGIMYIISRIAVLTDKRVRFIHSLAIAGALIVLVSPYAACDCGLQLSFASAYSCLMFNSLKIYYAKKRRAARRAGKRVFSLARLGKAGRAVRYVLETVLLTAIVNTMIFPLMWLYFGELSLVSLLTNLIFIPLITGLMYLSGLYLIVYPLKLFILPLGTSINVYTSLILELADVIAKLRNIVISVNYSFAVYFLVPIAVIFLLIPFMREKWLRRMLAVVGALFIAFFGAIGIYEAINRESVVISYISLKKNDGFAVKSGGRVLLCDMSDGSYGYLYELTNGCGDLNACEIEAVAFTHYHKKHVQYFTRLCEREIVRSVILPEPINEDETLIYSTLIDEAAYYGVDAHTVGVGEKYEFGNSDIVFHERSYISRSTHPISSASVIANDNTFTLLSCSFNESKSDNVRAYAESSDIVVFGHHNPKYKKAFDLSLKRQPKAVVVSDAAYEFMSEDLIEKIGRSEVYRECGRITFRIAESGYCTTVSE